MIIQYKEYKDNVLKHLLGTAGSVLFAVAGQLVVLAGISTEYKKPLCAIGALACAITAGRGKYKNPDFQQKSGFLYFFLLFFAVVPPENEFHF